MCYIVLLAMGLPSSCFPFHLINFLTNFVKFLFEFWPFEVSGHLMSLLSCGNHNLRTMYANVLKFHM